MTSTVLEMPTINLSATKLLIKAKIEEYNQDKDLGEQIRGHHYHDLWRLVEYFTFRIMEDNKNLPVNTRRIDINNPIRILHTTKLSRENLKEWFCVQSLNTVTSRLQRLAKAGFINMTKRGKGKKHLTSLLELNKDIIALEDVLNPNLKNHTEKSLKTRSNELKNDVKNVKNRFVDNQAVSLSKNQTSTPLLNTTKHNSLNNKLIENGVFSEKSEKRLSSFQNSANSANLLPGTPKQGNFEDMAKAARANYAEKINGSKKRNRFQDFSNNSDEQNLEDYRRAQAEYVFRESLVLWKGRNDVYEGEFRKAGMHVSDNYFKGLNRTQINSSVQQVLWSIKFQRNMAKTAKLEENKDQFVFYPHKYWSGEGVGTLRGVHPYYRKYVNGHSMSRIERATKKIPYRKVEKNFDKEFKVLKDYVFKFLSGKRTLKSLSAFEAAIKKKYPNKPKYIITFNKMVRVQVAL